MENIVRIVSVLQVILEVRRVNKTNQDNVLRNVNRCIACAVFQILSGKPGRFLKLRGPGIFFIYFQQNKNSAIYSKLKPIREFSSLLLSQTLEICKNAKQCIFSANFFFLLFFGLEDVIIFHRKCFW